MMPKRGRLAVGMRVIAVVTIVVATAMVADACVIADPPTDLPQLGELRPRIIRESVVPSTSSVIGQWPEDGKFIIPVELSNPLADLEWAAFVDYNPTVPSGYWDNSTVEKSPATGRIRMVEVELKRPLDNGCHIVEIVVALKWEGSKTTLSLHNPPAPGGDIATWVFNLSGDPSGCAVPDAGIRPLVDAATDAEAGTDQ